MECPELRESWPGNTREIGLPQKNHVGLIEFLNKPRKKYILIMNLYQWLWEPG
jgi:hypothetical protein